MLLVLVKNTSTMQDLRTSAVIVERRLIAKTLVIAEEQTCILVLSCGTITRFHRNRLERTSDGTPRTCQKVLVLGPLDRRKTEDCHLIQPAAFPIILCKIVPSDAFARFVEFLKNKSETMILFYRGRKTQKLQAHTVQWKSNRPSADVWNHLKETRRDHTCKQHGRTLCENNDQAQSSCIDL